MEELHPKKSSTAFFKDRVITVVVALFALAVFYGTVEDILLEFRSGVSGVDLAALALRAFMALAIFGGGGFVALGFFWRTNGAFLRLVDGIVEYRWKWWKWEYVQKVDLKTVRDVRIEDHISSYRGHTQKTPAFFFTRQSNLHPAAASLEREDPWLALPKGVTIEEANLFLQKVKQEIKRANGGW